MRRVHFLAILGAVLLSGCSSVQSSTPCPLTSSETKIGGDLKKLDEALQFACELGTTTLIISSNGKVVRAMGDVTEPYRVHSMRKALLSALVGQHIGTGFTRILSKIIEARIPDNQE